MSSSVELFTGCGGLAMGLSRAGFRSLRMVERDKHAVATVLHNRTRGEKYVADWPIYQEDVRTVAWSQYQGIDLVAGGPPCQPFSIGGRHKGQEDGRDMWPEAVRAVRETYPKAFIFENVRGLVRSTFSEYLEWVSTTLASPDITRLPNESLIEHVARIKKSGRSSYNVTVNLVNAADYGAAQKRHRVIIIGCRRDLGTPPPHLSPTHSRERLIWDQWVSGIYWERHNLRRPPAGPDTSDKATVRRLLLRIEAPGSLPWRTVRDAIQGLGEPGCGTSKNHDFQPGARPYPGHTGSPLDLPSKALKAGVHGVPGGENAILLRHGDMRYLSVREAARLQGMPDSYEFVGSWSENMRQLGNAVPVELAETVANRVREVLETRQMTSRSPQAAQ